MINFRQFQKEVETDKLWIAVKEFVAKRTGGVRAVKVVCDEEGNEIEDPNAPPKERRRIYDRFEFQGYGVCYGTGQIFRSGELEPEPEVYDEPASNAAPPPVAEEKPASKPSSKPSTRPQSPKQKSTRQETK